MYMYVNLYGKAKALRVNQYFASVMLFVVGCKKFFANWVRKIVVTSSYMKW